MADLPNGFTGYISKKQDKHFESAGEASRKLQEALKSGSKIPAPSTKSPIADSVLGRAAEREKAPAHSKVGRHAAQKQPGALTTAPKAGTGIGARVHAGGERQRKGADTAGKETEAGASAGAGSAASMDSTATTGSIRHAGNDASSKAGFGTRSKSSSGAHASSGVDAAASTSAFTVANASGVLVGGGTADSVGASSAGVDSAGTNIASSMRSGSILGSGISADLGAERSQFDLQALDGTPRPDQRWAWLEIDLSAIRHNVAETRRYLQPRTRLMAVVKADAYGHGAVKASKAMIGAGADRLAVATVPEGIQLRKAGITAPIAILDQPPITSVPLLLAYRITPTIYEPDFAIAYGEQADQHGMMAPYHLAINTGMNRVGVQFKDAVEFLQAVSFHRALELEGTFTHFATADSSETLDFRVAAKRFAEALESIRGAGFDPGIVHAANSAATYRFPEVRYDMVRCGLALYGVHPCDETRDHLDIRPAMSVHARIIDARNVPVSEGVSYGYRYRSPGSVRICTLPLGYADGLRRGLSGKIDFIMDGRYYRQVGAICMDQCMFEVDLRDRKNAVNDYLVGDHVIIVGSEGAAEVTVDEHAEKLSTVPYEIMVGFSQRLARVYE